MKRELRLRRSSEFSAVFKEGKRFLSPHFVLYIRRNNQQAPRLGVSISRTSVKQATRRNRIRRIAKAIFEQEIANHIKGYDFVITSRGTKGAGYKRDINAVIEELKCFVRSVNEKVDV